MSIEAEDIPLQDTADTISLDPNSIKPRLLREGDDLTLEISLTDALSQDAILSVTTDPGGDQDLSFTEEVFIAAGERKVNLVVSAIDDGNREILERVVLTYSLSWSAGGSEGDGVTHFDTEGQQTSLFVLDRR